MEPVGIVSIVLGVLVVCGRGFLVVEPGATLRWFQSESHYTSEAGDVSCGSIWIS